MRLTDSQERWLRWLHENGGSAYIERQSVIANGCRSLYGSAISFLNLVAKGMIEAKNGRLVITNYGRRQIGLPESEGAQ